MISQISASVSEDCVPNIMKKERSAKNRKKNYSQTATHLRRKAQCSGCCLHGEGCTYGKTHSAFGEKTTNTLEKGSFQVEAVGIPGLQKIFDKDYTIIGKAFWIIAIVGCFVSCSVLTLKGIIKFAKTPISVRVEVIREVNLTFPAVTICPFYPFLFNENFNRWRRQYHERFNVTFQPLKYYESNTSIPFLNLLRLPNVSAADLWNRAKVGNLVVHIECQFESKRNCKRKVILKEVPTHFGICITGISDKNIIYDGAYNGITYDLLEHNNQKTAYWQHTILLHDPDDDPTHILYREGGQPVHPMRETTVTFLMKKYKRVNITRRPCLPTRKVTQCISECIKKHIQHSIDCTLPFFNSPTLPQCQTSESAARTYDVTLNIYKNLENLCTHCPDKCTEFYFSPLFDAVYLRDNTSVKVILLDNNINMVEQYATYPFDSLLADVGGNLGLFLGVCTLTLCELLEALAAKLKSMKQCRGDKGSRKRSPVTPIQISVDK